MAYTLDLSGRVALITGASGGLGEQFAKTLANAGAAVVLASRRTDRLMALRAHIEAEGGDAHVVALDVTDLASIKAAIARVQAQKAAAADAALKKAGVTREALTAIACTKGRSPAQYPPAPNATAKTVAKITRPTPSLNRDSPSIWMAIWGGAFIFLTMASTAMGSVGEIRAPNSMQ